ncbi:putative toxin-antitoxin system toxin component, PIN family [Candidatus Electronema sp. TJ]|uniref:putative toxin-antitoxin system toxin component, PIN family n=1 Tax=Candidatus Electronema sp. TJ TaxID=3401573 RepID=UPI003AA9D0DE
MTLDTNVLYQALRSADGASHYILSQVRQRNIHIAFSVALFNEYEDVLKRSASLEAFGMNASDIDKFLRFIAFAGVPCATYFLFRPNLRDEKDNMVLEAAISSQSDYLITSNIKDFSGAELRFDQIRIETPTEFVKIWRKLHGKG